MRVQFSGGPPPGSGHSSGLASIEEVTLRLPLGGLRRRLPMPRIRAMRVAGECQLASPPGSGLEKDSSAASVGRLRAGEGLGRTTTQAERELGPGEERNPVIREAEEDWR